MENQYTEAAYQAAQRGETIAYDYERQRWVTGEAALICRRDQTRASIALLSGPEGEKYAAFIGIADRFAALDAHKTALASIEALLAALQAPEAL